MGAGIRGLAMTSDFYMYVADDNQDQICRFVRIPPGGGTNTPYTIIPITQA